MKFKRAASRAVVKVAFMFALALFARLSPASGQTNNSDDRLGLADLPAEHAALAGKATIDGPQAHAPPQSVTFRDLWNHPETWRGRRVRVQGTIARIFRQGAVGSFPPLAEAWLSTPEGDLLCVVFPQEDHRGQKTQTQTHTNANTGPAQKTRDEPAPARQLEPEPGRRVTFTGTFLKTIRYPAADLARLAPLIVGDRPPTMTMETAVGGKPSPAEALRPSDTRPRSEVEVWTPAAWVLSLALGLAAAAVLAWQHIRGAPPSKGKRLLTRGQRHAPATPLPPLEFLDTEPDDGAVVHDARPGHDPLGR
jgi:hypothetical protein